MRSMADLRIRLFGGIEIHHGGEPLTGFATKRAELLFAYLVLNRGRVLHRDVLCGHLWSDQPDADARKALRTALWRIRAVLEPSAEARGRYVRVDGASVGFTEGPGVWVDAWEFEDCAGLLGSGGGEGGAACIERLSRAAELYSGDLLDGHYDEWCLRHRDRLQGAYLNVLERLVAHHQAAGRWLEAIGWGRLLLERDPLREHIHRAVMASHFAMGDRPSALRQYEGCVRSLAEELDIEPMEETHRLYEQIRSGSTGAGDPRTQTGERGEPWGPRGVAAEVEGALRMLYELTERLEKTRVALAVPSPAPLPPARRDRVRPGPEGPRERPSPAAAGRA